MASHLVPVVACEGRQIHPCGRRIQLPYSIRQQTIARQPDQPKADWTLNLVCADCGFRDDYDRSRIQWESVPEEIRAAGLPGTVLWRIEFECGRESCGALMVTHTMGFRDASESCLRGIVEHASPPLFCDKGGGHLSFPLNPRPVVLDEAW
jgi:hypothetical protein